MSRRYVHWTRSLGQPFSKGGSPICDKHDFIEANSADPEMAYEIAEVARAALEDGQNMEKALKERKDANEELQSELDWANEQIQAMQAHARRLRISQLRRMAHEASLSADWTRPIVHRSRLFRFAKRCYLEIERLRGEG